MSERESDFRGERILDWRNLNEYAGCENRSLREWAWEFLRRNPDYQSACNEVDGKWDSPESEVLASEFGLSRLHDFHLSERPVVLSSLRCGMLVRPKRPIDLSQLIHPDVLLMKLDLNVPEGLDQETAINYYLVSARKLIELRLKEKFKYREKVGPPPPRRMLKYPEYIRVLDALLDGASIDEMVKTICPEEESIAGQSKKKIAAQIKAATLLTLFEYHRLAFEFKKTV